MKLHTLSLFALPLLVACGGTYSTNVVRAPSAPTLSPLPMAEVTRTKPPTAGAEVARIEAQGTAGANSAQCQNYLASEAAKLGSPVVVMDADPAVANGGPHCAGTAYAPGSPTGK